jgi:hypothetical protein
MERGTARRGLRAFALAGAVVLVAAGATAASAARPASPRVDLHTAAGLAPDGRSLTVQLVAACDPRSTVVEAVVRVSQREAAGQASFALTCTGSLRPFTVTVAAAPGGTFELGEAQATATVVVRRGKLERAQDSEVVLVQPLVDVELSGTGRLDGGAVIVGVTVACPAGATGLQSFVNVTQGNVSGNGSYLTVCDGTRHTFSVRVTPSSGAYQPGSARALTFANIEHDGIGTAGVADRPLEIVG